MTNKTITFDPAVYKLVPVTPTADMLEDYGTGYSDILTRIPDTLPGMVVHSGEPIYWLEAEESARNAGPTDILGRYSMLYSSRTSPKEPAGSNPRWPLFTHPPAQPDNELANVTEELDCMNRNYQALQQAHKTLKAQLAAQAGQECHICHQPKNMQGSTYCSFPHPPAPANSLAIAQAALEAAAQVSTDMMRFDAAAAIRAIDPQSVIDGMGK